MVALRHGRAALSCFCTLPLWDLFSWNILGWRGPQGIIESISTVTACYGQSHTNSFVKEMQIVPDKLSH